MGAPSGALSTSDACRCCVRYMDVSVLLYCSHAAAWSASRVDSTTPTSLGNAVTGVKIDIRPHQRIASRTTSSFEHVYLPAAARTGRLSEMTAGRCFAYRQCGTALPSASPRLSTLMTVKRSSYALCDSRRATERGKQLSRVPKASNRRSLPRAGRRSSRCTLRRTGCAGVIGLSASTHDLAHNTTCEHDGSMTALNPLDT